jgi:alkylated DNA nucleotide flippase Atl1
MTRIYMSTPPRLHGVVLNSLSTGTNLPLHGVISQKTYIRNVRPFPEVVQRTPTKCLLSLIREGLL